jgi:5'-deoxynucleotidase YfbR-like HD superfamily hydrolase
LVRELTRSEPSPEEIAGMSKDEIAELRSRTLLDEIKQMGPEAQLVKLADRLSNLTSYVVTRKGKKLDRYLKQSKEVLKIIPRKKAPAIWDEIDGLLKKEK